MDEGQWLDDRFERHRPHLRRVAHRMLGSTSDADDALQEAWLRVRDQDTAGVDNMQAWLTTVVGRVCLNILRSRRARSGDASVHIASPVIGWEEQDPAHHGLLADSVGLALLVVLETLTPAERLAFVLHDVFGVPFADVAAALDRSEQAAQQLASRARRRVRSSPEPAADLARQREVVDAFFAASRDGDFETLLRVLHPDVELRIDGGTLRSAASFVGHGPQAVAARTLTYAKLYPFISPALVNGGAGVVVAPHGEVFSVMAFRVEGGRITRIEALVDPERLAQLDLPGVGDR